LEIFPLNHRTVGGLVTILAVAFPCSRSVFAAARHGSFEKTLNERIDALLDAEKTA
jgi:hypothetical protein